MDRLLQNRNFRLHWASVAISQIGSFFTMVALPWLVLYTTDNDPVIMSTVLATTSLPHGFFILFGGALADRVSPLRVLYISRAAFVLVMGSLSLLVYAGLIPLWLIYLYAFVLGTLGAFSIPSSQALLPSLLPPAALGQANGIVMATMQVAQMVGPVLAGWLIWFGRSLTGVPAGIVDYASLALAFAVDAGAVLCAVILMSFMRVEVMPRRDGHLFRMVAQGFLFCWHDTGIRLVLSYLVMISFCLHGPLLSALPLFTKLELGLSEGAYGSLYAMLGMGTVVGAGIAMLKVSGARRLGEVTLCCDLISGLGFYSMAQFHNPWIAGGLLFIMGVCSGIIMVAGTTWFQHRTPEAYMGRAMGVLMFAIIGLIPLSATLSGFLIEHSSVTLAMSAAGAVMALLAGIGLLLPQVRNMGDLPPLDARALISLKLHYGQEPAP
ncbi:MAG TPA: MFS transporter [Gammaproteobacteria bacterium]|nr:MFS transporter [Gammaproteobacteria bacterium]